MNIDGLVPIGEYSAARDTDPDKIISAIEEGVIDGACIGGQ